MIITHPSQFIYWWYIWSIRLRKRERLRLEWYADTGVKFNDAVMQLAKYSMRNYNGRTTRYI